MRRALPVMRHLGGAMAAPPFGWIADRVGSHQDFVFAEVVTISGFLLCVCGAGLAVPGALIMLLFRGALASLAPAVVAETLPEDEDLIGRLARMQAWRDLGAACGPLMTGVLLPYVSAEAQHAMVVVALSTGLLFWIRVSFR